MVVDVDWALFLLYRIDIISGTATAMTNNAVRMIPVMICKVEGQIIFDATAARRLLLVKEYMGFGRIQGGKRKIRNNILPSMIILGIFAASS